MKIIIGLLSLLLLSSCASELTTGREVMLVSTLSATESLQYIEIGPITASEPAQFLGDEESCLNQLRNKAAGQGADIIVVEDKTRSDCGPGHQCIKIHGRAYKRKQ